jgi:hypothetical protein
MYPCSTDMKVFPLYAAFFVAVQKQRHFTKNVSLLWGVNAIKSSSATSHVNMK